MHRFECGYAQSPLLAWKHNYMQLKAQPPESGRVRLLLESNFGIRAGGNKQHKCIVTNEYKYQTYI